MRSLAGSLRLRSSSTKSIKVMITSVARIASSTSAHTPWVSNQPIRTNTAAYSRLRAACSASSYCCDARQGSRSVSSW